MGTPNGVSSCFAGVGIGTGDECCTARLDDEECLRRTTSNIGLSDGDCSKLSASEGLVSW
jgi:hypothetical protein